MTEYRGIYVRRTMSLPERLAHYAALSDSGCLEWTAATDGRMGYGKLKWGDRMHYVHRLSWEHANGRPVPTGMVVMHSCDNPPCLLPDHLSIGAQLENVADCARKGRRRSLRGETHPLAKLTDEQTDMIRSEVSSGASQASMARRYGVSGATVWRVVNSITHR